jgi:Xaa-Pro dipeptidase
MPPAFPVDEYRARMSRAGAALADAGLSGCVASAPEHLYYLGGYDAHTHFSEQALVFAADGGDPTLVIRDVDVPPGSGDLWFGDVRAYRYGGDDPVRLIAMVAREKGLSGRIGLDLESHALPGGFALALIEALAPTEVVDATDLVGRLRFGCLLMARSRHGSVWQQCGDGLPISRHQRCDVL